jgi:hypothetical protein
MDEKKKVKVNIIYSPQGCDGTSPRFVNEKGEVWMHGSRKDDMHNISMSFYSANYPDPAGPNDSIYVIEPRCVAERDYELKFLRKFKYVFTWATKAFENTVLKNKIISLHHPSLLGINESVYEQRKKEWKPWSERKNQIVFIANNKSSDHPSQLYSLRLKLADWLYENYKNYEVAWYSQIPVNRPYYKGKISSDKFEILKDVKFSVCTENSYHSSFSHNYFTEKLPEVWLGGAVPIYMGCYNINDFGFNNNSYIDLRNFIFDNNPHDINFPAIVHELDSFTEEKYNLLKSGIEYNVNERKLFDLISEYKVMEKMIDVFYNE